MQNGFMSFYRRCFFERMNVLCCVAKAAAAKHKKPILPKKILIPQSDQEDSTQDSVSECVINVRHTFSNVLMSLFSA